ncbi:hypothetical protein FB567DRAFT_320816 [Paraphoma chrysanthemicola]|uniref:Uncharacterized protein n=1 Tax=Paraphoma chrysanthemicola TaxID=798071 RepID=A0A8K0RB68_9PLEO|nr:hypothetical protein FB567DRAFT_320816 [Paraphoma chrysanthemicola]
MATSMLNPTAPAWTPNRLSQHRDSNSMSPMTPPIPLSFNATAFVPQQVQQHFHPVNGYYPNDAQYNGYYPQMHFYNGYNMAYPSYAHGYAQNGYAKYGANEHYASQEHPHHVYAPYQGHSNVATGPSSNGGDADASQFQAQGTFGSQFHLINNQRAALRGSLLGFNGWYNSNGYGNGNGNGNAVAGFCANAVAGVDANGGETKRKKKNNKNKKKKTRKTRKDSKQDTDGDGNKATSAQKQGDADSASLPELIQLPNWETMGEVE